MENTKRIRVISSLGRRICTVLIFLVPIMSAFFWVFFNKWYPIIRDLGIEINLVPVQIQDLSAMARFMGFIVSLLPNIVTIYGIIKLRRLFSLYEKEIIFSKDNIKCFRGMGWVLIGLFIANKISDTLLSAVYTFENPPGQRSIIALWFSSGDFTPLVLGMVVLFISWAMDEGRRIKEEHTYEVAT